MITPIVVKMYINNIVVNIVIFKKLKLIQQKRVLRAIDTNKLIIGITTIAFFDTSHKLLVFLCSSP